MTDLMTTLPWLGAGAAVLVAIVLGLGLALHFQSRIPYLAQPAIGALLTIIPPIGLVLVGRNLALKNLDFNVVIDPGGIAAWILRGTSAALVGLSIAIILSRLLDRDARTVAKGRPLMLAFLVYFLTNVVLAATFGTVPGILYTYFYPLILVLGLFMVREQGYANLLVAIRWGLTLMMVASVALIPFMPNLVMQPNSPEARLPGITFRFFGVGSGPNSIGPLAVTLILIAIHLPFKSKLVQLASLLSAFIVLVLAQSQTSWIAAAVIIPPLLVYRWSTGESNGRPRQLSPSLILGLVGMTSALALAVSFVFVDWPGVFATLADFIGYGQGLANRSFTGRGAIWVVAFETFLDNPLFGYGVTAWDRIFRAKINMPFAFHAHNQVMQSLSVGGLLGVLGLVFYIGTLAFYSLKFARFTRGLAPALLVLILVRCISEVPLDILVLLAGDFVTHLALFSVLAASAAMSGRHVAARSRAQIQAWVTSAGTPGFAPARSIPEDDDVDERALDAIVRRRPANRGPGGAAPIVPSPRGPWPRGPSSMGPSPMGPSPMGPSPMRPSSGGPSQPIAATVVRQPRAPRPEQGAVGDRDDRPWPPPLPGQWPPPPGARSLSDASARPPSGRFRDPADAGKPGSDRIEPRFDDET